MVAALDEAVDNVTAALDAAQMMPRTLLLFTTDNGAPFKHVGGATMSNFPLREWLGLDPSASRPPPFNPSALSSTARCLLKRSHLS